VRLLEEYTDHIRSVFQEEVDNWSDPAGIITERPSLSFKIIDDYPVMKLNRESTVIKRVEAAAASLGIELDYVIAGGGSDANIFNSYSLQCAILSTGMDRVHSTRETIKLSDMVHTANLIMAIIS
jgi:tripeptide aminopeptidase